MKIRNITKEDLPIIAKFARNKKICGINNIYYKLSKICFSDDGEILCYILVCRNSLIDFFGGNIPADENVDVEDEDYDEENDKWWVKKVATLLEGRHYEIVDAYLKKETDSIVFFKVLSSIESEYVSGFLWSKKELPDNTHFYLFNTIVWVDFPYIDYDF